MRKPAFLALALVGVFSACTRAKDEPTSSLGAPFQPGSPWPKFRGDVPNSGRAHAAPTDRASGKFWSFRTGQGVFSSPIVGADERVYVGSADRFFYALAPDGTLSWKYLTGEVIDSSGLLDDLGCVYFGSGDGVLRAVDAAYGSPIWTMQADDPSTTGAYIDWFEGNVALTPSGALWVPNDNHRLYRIDRDDGSVGLRVTMPDQTWSLPAIDPKSETLYLGNNNEISLLGQNTFAIDASGQIQWEQFSLGSIAASPALSDDGKAIYVGGFDGFVRAYSTADGSPLWSFATRDHVYASPALLPDGTVVEPSADGTVYALDPATGALRWSFDTTEAIRSSPAVDIDGNVYFGGGDGRLYALDSSGKLRWSIALVTDARNDVNASPALGNRAIYVGAESGEVFAVPYDGCASPSLAGDPRCAPRVDGAKADGASIFFTSQWGGRIDPAPSTLDANQPITFSLVVKKQGVSQLAILDAASLAVDATPQVELDLSIAGDGKFVTVTPKGAFPSGSLSLRVHGNVLGDLTRNGLQLSGGKIDGAFDATFTFAVRAAASYPLPVAAPSTIGAPAGVWELSRLALPLPTILPSYDQIGFDSLHYLVGVVEASTDSAGVTHGVAWMIGAKLDGASDATVVDPATKSLLPLSLTYAGGALTLANANGLTVDVSSVVIPLDTFRVAGFLQPDGAAADGVRVSGSANCSTVPTYGTFLQLLGLCNPATDLLSVFGGADWKPYGAGVMAVPAGVGATTFTVTKDAIVATLAGSTLRLADHGAAILLVDATTGAPLTFDYGHATGRTAASDGTLATVTLPLAGKTLPSSVRAYLMIDAVPAAMQTLAAP